MLKVVKIDQLKNPFDFDEFEIHTIVDIYSDYRLLSYKKDSNEFDNACDTHREINVNSEYDNTSENSSNWESINCSKDHGDWNMDTDNQDSSNCDIDENYAVKEKSISVSKKAYSDLNKSKPIMLSNSDKNFRFIKGNKGADESFKDADDLDELSDANESLDMKIKKNVSKTKIVYSEDFGTATILTTAIASSDGYAQYNLLRYEIDVVLRKEFRCPCPLSFYSGIRANQNGSFVGYSTCGIASHLAMFRFYAFEVDEHIMAINVSSNLPMITSHGVDIIKPFSRTCSTERNELKKLLKYRSVRMAHLEINANCDPELAADGYVDGAKSFKVLQKVISEARCEGRLHLESIDIEDAVQLWIEQHKLGNKAVRYFMLSLQLLPLFTEKQL